MTGIRFLDWAGLSVSLFNTMVLIWLGLTVFLNSQRRNAGMWIVSSQLLLGGIFFLSHTVILSQPFISSSPDLNFWWRLGWIPVVALPYAWYAVVLWYAGFWSNRGSPLYLRHAPWFYLASALALLVAVMLILANPLPSLTQLLNLNFDAALSLFGIPAIILVYPIFIAICIGLSVDALRRPAPSHRMMGDLARQRARPWLLSASIVLVLVGLLVGGIMYWIFANASSGSIQSSFVSMVGWFDLVIASLIAAAIWMVGQAIVSYEVFTGHTLPRQGLRRHWIRILILSAGFSVAVSLGLTLQLPSVYLLLLSALLISVFYALLSWRSFIEHEEHLSQLRPFVSNQKLLDQLLAPSNPDLLENRILIPFHSLCAELLRTQRAGLIPVGAVTQVFGEPVFYPAGFSPQLPNLGEISFEIASTNVLCVPLDPTRWEGMHWALPLWSDRGLIGILLLGDKMDSGFYTQEEFEIARSAGERLLDTQASVELSRRLFLLQRQRLSQNRLLDHQTRRILHDEVLPLLHTAMLNLDRSQGDKGEKAGEAIKALASVHHQIAGLIRELPRPYIPALKQEGLSGALKRMVATELPDAFAQVTWQVDPVTEAKEGSIPEWALEVVYYAAREAIRNADRHAAGEKKVDRPSLDICETWSDGLELRIRNSSVSSAPSIDTVGSGQGLSLHSTMIAVIGGSLAIESDLAGSTQVTIHLPGSQFSGVSRD